MVPQLLFNYNKGLQKLMSLHELFKITDDELAGQSSVVYNYSTWWYLYLVLYYYYSSLLLLANVVVVASEVLRSNW